MRKLTRLEGRVIVKRGINKKQDSLQKCPKCGYLIGAIKGSREAICSNCGFKDSCCY